MNGAIFFALMSPAFLFILVIGIFSSGGNVAIETVLLPCKKMSDLAVGE